MRVDPEREAGRCKPVVFFKQGPAIIDVYLHIIGYAVQNTHIGIVIGVLLAAIIGKIFEQKSEMLYRLVSNRTGNKTLVAVRQTIGNGTGILVNGPLVVELVL